MFQLRAKIIQNKKIGGGYFHYILETPIIAKKAIPGQFVSVKLSDGTAPLLRRPFSIHRVNDKKIEILYALVGRGTELLSRKKSGEFLDLIGPLGNGFSYRRTNDEGRKTIIVAGGIGVAPLTFLAERLMETELRLAPNYKKYRGIPLWRETPNSEPIILIGAKTKNQILCEKEFRSLGCEVKIATDDGTKGFKGRVTDLLKHILRGAKNEWRGTIYACGPKPMLKGISNISQQYKIPAQVSLEEHMACGIGACLGCVIKVKSQKSKVKTDFEYKRVCKDGTVFNADEITWEG